MARKKEPACETEKYTFPSRLRGLMQDRGTRQKELADAIGMRPQTVSLYTQGQSFPDVNGLEKIARFFSVSADYLLGLTDTPSIDEDVQTACKVTGLSAESINFLSRIFRHDVGVVINGRACSSIDVIDKLLSDQRFLAATKLIGLSLLWSGEQSTLEPEEMKRLIQWGEAQGVAIIPGDLMGNVYLQTACDSLKIILRDIVEEVSDDGKH